MLLEPILPSYILTTVFLVIVHLHFVICQPVSIKAELETYNLRLSKGENYLIDLSYFSQQIDRDYRVLTITHLNPGFNQSVDPTIENIRWVRFLTFSDNFTLKDCATNISPSFAGNSSFANRGIISRTVVGRNRTMYVTTVHLVWGGMMIGTNPSLWGYNNRVETLGIAFSQTGAPVVKEMTLMEQPSYHQNLSAYTNNQYKMCYAAVYLPLLKETFSVCRRFASVNNTEVLYVMRSGEETVYDIQIRVNSTTPNKEQIKIKYVHISGTSYELWIYIRGGSRSIWYLTVDKTRLQEMKIFTLVYCPMSIDFAGRFLMLLTTSVSCNVTALDKKIYWYTRNPGEPVSLIDPNLLVDGTFLNWYSSNEDTELIFETYRDTNVPKIFGDSHRILVSSFSFDVVSRKISLTKTFLIAVYYSSMAMIDVKYVLGVKAREQSRYLVNTGVLIYTLNAQKTQYVVSARGSIGIWYTNDPYTGFMGTQSYNQTFNLFTQFPVGTDYRDNNLFMVTYETSLGWSTSYHNCSVIRQDIGFDFLQVKNVLNDDKFFKYLNLSLYDSTVSKHMFIFNIEFLEDKELLPQQDKLWLNSNDTMYQEAVQDSEKYVALKMLVRGPMAVPKMGSHIPLLVDYTRAPAHILKEIESKALFTTESFAFSSLSDELTGRDLEDCIGFLYSSPQFTFEKTFLLLKKTGVSQTFVFEYRSDTGVLTKKNPLPISSRISWAYPLKKNLYLLASQDGSLCTFNSDQETLVDIPYVGTACISVALAFHSGLKPSLVCLNQNMELAYYYLDQLLQKSLINGRLIVDTPQLLPFVRHSNLSSCSLRTGDEFEGKVFVYCPATDKDKATVSIFYLEVEDNLQVIFIESVEFISMLPDQYRLRVARVHSFDIASDVLVVSFKGSLGVSDCVAVWKYEREGYFKLMKITDLPMEWLLESKPTFMFRRHFISKSFYNPAPGILMEVLGNQNGERNLIFVDTKSPEIETFRAPILPRSSKGSGFHPMPILGFTETNQRLNYIGIVFWQQSSSLGRGSSEYVPRVHIVYPGEPKVKAPSDNNLAYKEVFTSAVSKDQKYTLEFDSHVLLQRSQSRPISKTFQLIRPVVNYSTVTTPLPDVRLEYEHQLERFSNDLQSEVKIFSKPFREIFNLTVIEWNTATESIFDDVIGTVSTTKPIAHLKTTQTGQNLRGILEYKPVCLQFAKPLEVKDCIKKGIVLFYANMVLMKYDNQLMFWKPNNIVQYNFTQDKCTKFWHIHNNLGSLCTMGLERKLTIFNPTTLEIRYFSSASTFNFDPEHTIYKTAFVQKVHFLMLSSTILDDFNRRGVGRSLLYVYSGSVLETDKILPSTTFREVLITDAQQADQCIEAHYNTSSGNYFVTVNSVAIGNYKQLKFSLRVTFEMRDTFRNDSVRSTITGEFRVDRLLERSIRFTTPDYSRVKEEIFAHVQIIPLLFDSKEQFFSQPIFTDAVSNTLVYFPNYHSYVMRYRGLIHPCNSSMYRLWNAFQGMMNEYVEQTPSCQSWACALVYQKGKRVFVSVYDMHFEQIRATGSNFQEIFSTPNASVNCSAASESQLFDLTMIPPKYTRYPMQILNLTGVERVQFDPTVQPYIYTKENLNQTFSESTLDYSLRLQVFFSDGRLSVFNVSRSLNVQLQSPSVSSNFVTVQIQQPNAVSTEFKVWIPSYLTQKQRIIPVCLYLAGLVLGAGLLAICLRVRLRTELRQTVQFMKIEKQAKSPEAAKPEGDTGITAEMLT